MSSALLFVTLLFATTPLATAYHLLRVQHHWCDEHDSFEHDCSNEGDDQPLAYVPLGVTPLANLDYALHSHLICHQLVQTNRDVRSQQGVDETPRSLPVVSRHIGRALLPELRGAVIEVAPKQSPPVLS